MLKHCSIISHISKDPLIIIIFIFGGFSVNKHFLGCSFICINPAESCKSKHYLCLATLLETFRNLFFSNLSDPGSCVLLCRRNKFKCNIPLLTIISISKTLLICDSEKFRRIRILYTKLCFFSYLCNLPRL